MSQKRDLFYLNLLMSCLIGAFSFGCGSKKTSGGGGKSKAGVVEKAFDKAAKTNGIPKRFLIAAALLESNLSPEKENAPYYDTDGETQKLFLGTKLSETAFGISQRELGIAGLDGADTLPVQIEAYGKWVKENIENSAQLSLSPSKLDEKYYWIWELAKLHRNGDDYRRNVRVIWATEFIEILNHGRSWQDQANGDSINLNPESPPIDIEKLPADGRKWFHISKTTGEVINSQMFELTNPNIPSVFNTPSKIIVTHCPLSLSACLELQDSESESEIALGAHYIIPQDKEVYESALQLVPHDRIVILTDQNGRKSQISDAIVIMLQGNSGRYVGGLRKNADPTWFNAWQLTRLSAIINGVCTRIATDFKTVDARTCQEPENPQGIHFYHQGNRMNYRWGDIPDFDKAIFYGYLRSSDANLEGEISFRFSNAKKTYKANKNFKFDVSYPPGIYELRLQRAVRCKNDQLVWETITSTPAKNTSKWTFEQRMIDAGPNDSGQQFMRVLAFDKNSDLMAWAIDDLYITDFDEDYHPEAEMCLNRSEVN